MGNVKQYDLGPGGGRVDGKKMKREREKDKTIFLIGRTVGGRVNELKIQQDFFTIRRQ
jgi:hypothetical protein